MISDSKNPQSGLASAMAFIAIVVAVGLLIGYMTPPGQWYEGLQKPFFNPPGWVFGPVWTVLYVLIGIAGWRIWSIAPRSTAMMLWGAQMVLNWLWSPAFFALQSPALALAIIIAMLALVLLFIVNAWKLDRLAAWLFVPYAAWVSFATALNASIVYLN
ncbi:MAG: tryptophan-rich sensory protein [Rhizobiaceae bacterium]|nr:tryptophan-rich sensory protein [Rhizobiaceae bacterium]